MTTELQCVLNCGSDDCNGECDIWNEIKSALIVLKKYINLIDFDTLLEILDADERLINFEKSICTRDLSKMLQDSRKDSAFDIDFVATLSGYEFELLIAELYTVMGYSVTQTKKSHDEGIDIIAERDNKFILIQCKRYSPKNKVKLGAVRDFFGAINASPTKGEGIIISTTDFTKFAEDFAAKSEIKIINRIDLMLKLNEYLPRELPGFKIESGLRVFSDDFFEVNFKLINTSKKIMKFLHVSLRLFNDDDEQIDEVIPDKGSDTLEVDKDWKYKFCFVPYSQIKYYKIHIQFKRNKESIIKHFQGSMHYL